jgi:hypothetical protein
MLSLLSSLPSLEVSPPSFSMESFSESVVSLSFERAHRAGSSSKETSSSDEEEEEESSPSS